MCYLFRCLSFYFVKKERKGKKKEQRMKEFSIIPELFNYSLNCKGAEPGGRAFAGIAGSNPAAGMDVCCVSSGRGLCDWPIHRPEESY